MATRNEVLRDLRTRGEVTTRDMGIILDYVDQEAAASGAVGSALLHQTGSELIAVPAAQELALMTEVKHDTLGLVVGNGFTIPASPTFSILQFYCFGQWFPGSIAGETLRILLFKNGLSRIGNDDGGLIAETEEASPENLSAGSAPIRDFVAGDVWTMAAQKLSGASLSITDCLFGVTAL